MANSGDSVVLALTKEDTNAAPTRFQSWNLDDSYKDCKIWEIARATSAATTFFPPISLGRPSIEFLDAGLNTNNPASVLLGDAYGIFKPDKIACLLSIGTGVESALPIKDGMLRGCQSILQALAGLATSSSRVHRDLDQRLYYTDTIYYRFDVPKGLNSIALSEWRKTPEINTHAMNYVGEPGVGRRLQQCAKVISEPSSSSPQMEFIVPRWERPFVGRESILKKIDKRMQESDLRKRRVALIGMGGVGKSEIAHQYAFLRKDSCSVFWINAQDKASVKESFMSIARRLGEEVKDFDGALQAYLKWCFGAEKRGISWLVIMDNVRSWEIILPYLKDCENCELLLTARHRAIAEAQPSFHTLQVMPMEEEDALVMLLGSILKSEEDEEGIDEEAIKAWVASKGEVSANNQTLEKGLSKRLVDCYEDVQDLNKHCLRSFPLAIAQCSAYLRKNKVTLGHYKSEFKFRREKLLSFEIKFAEYNESIMTTWEISHNDVKTECPQATEVLNLLGYIQHQEIPDSLFTDALRDTEWWGGGIKLVMPQRLRRELEFLDTEHAVYDLQNSLGTLEELSLISQSLVPGIGQQTNKVIRMHPLVSDWIQLRLQPQEQLFQIEKVLHILYFGLPPLIRSRADKNAEMLSIRVLVHGQTALQHMNRYLQLNEKISSVPSDCIALFLELYLWHQGSEFFRITDRLTASDEDQSWLYPLIAATGILHSIDCFETMNEAGWPNFGLVLSDFYEMLLMNEPPFENIRAWLLYAIISEKLCRHIWVKWTSGRDIENRCQITADERDSIIEVIPHAVKRFSTPAFTVSQDQNTTVSVCKAIIINSYANFLRGPVDSAWFGGPFSSANAPSYDKEKDVKACISAMKTYQEAAVIGLKCGIHELDSYFATALFISKTSPEYPDFIFNILDHPTMAMHTLQNNFSSQVSLISLERALEAATARPTINQVILRGPYTSYPQGPGIFEKFYPWILMIAVLLGKEKKFQDAVQLLKLHYGASSNKGGIQSIETQTLAFDIASLYRKSRQGDGKMRAQQAAFFKHVVEECQTNLESDDTFIFRWHMDFFDSISEYEACMHEILRNLPENSAAMCREQFAKWNELKGPAIGWHEQTKYLMYKRKWAEFSE